MTEEQRNDHLAIISGKRILRRYPMTHLSVIKPNDIVTDHGITGVIGSGRCGTVRLCKSNHLGLIAVKCYQLAGVTEVLEQRKERINEEANILLKLSHKNIIKVFGVTSWANSFGILTEYLPGGNLDHFLSNKHISVVPWCVKLRIAEELSEAISFLHIENGIYVYVHGDIKPENILLSEDLTIKLADFGSVNITRCTGATTLTVGYQSTNKQHTPFYTAPEFLKDVTLRRETTMDVYSFGMVLYEIVTRKRVFANISLNREAVLQVICDQGQKPDLVPVEEIKSNLSTEHTLVFNLLMDIMTRSWSQLPGDRPKMQEVQSSLFQELQKVDKATGEQEVKKLTETLKFQHVVVDEKSSATLNCFSYPFEEAPFAFPSDHSSTSLNTSSQHLPNNSSHVDAQDGSKQDHRTFTDDLTQPPNEDHCDERTALLSDSNSKSRYFTRKRKCVCCAIIAASILVIASAGFAVYLRLITTSTHAVTFCGQISIPGIDQKSYCVSKNKIVPINGGSTSIGYPNGTTCHIACSSSYILHGAKIVSCNTSSWQPILPVCQIEECPPFNLTAFVEKSCTNGRDVSSVCSFKCVPGKHLVGMSSITCQTSLKWSDVPPTCSASCPKCLTGPDCKESTSWAKLVLFIKRIGAWGTTVALYAGYSITCHVNKHGGFFSFRWDCNCTDILSSLNEKCSDYKTTFGSCEHALGELVRKMVARGTYPEPCDATSMTVGCKK